MAVDEAKDIRDKALALEAYYRQARNLDAEREAANVRLRAERRVGELLKELERAPPAERAEAANASMGRSSPGVTNVSPYASALRDHGISRQTAHSKTPAGDGGGSLGTACVVTFLAPPR